jgi:hypothetical protein
MERRFTFGGVCDGWWTRGLVYLRVISPEWELWEALIPISTAPAVEPAMMERNALG